MLSSSSSSLLVARSSLRLLLAQRSAVSASASSASAQVRHASSGSGPWGPMSFAGVNWKGDGALPFTTTKRGRFLTLFWTMVVVGFGLPFANTEWKLAPLREAKRNELKAAAEAEE